MKTILSERTVSALRILGIWGGFAAVYSRVRTGAHCWEWMIIGSIALVLVEVVRRSYLMDRRKSTRLRNSIRDLRKIQWMTAGWGNAFQTVINAVRIVDEKAFRADASEILKLSAYLDKSGADADDFDKYCSPNFNDFRNKASTLLQLLERQLEVGLLSGFLGIFRPRTQK